MGTFGQSFHASTKAEALDKVKADESAPKEVDALVNSLIKNLPDNGCSVQVEYSGSVNAASSSITARVMAQAPMPTNTDIVPKAKK